MKKVILSAFAMSLIILSAPLLAQSDGLDEFLSLESESFPEVKKVSVPAKEVKSTPKSQVQSDGIDDFLSLDTEVMPEMLADQRFTTPALHENPEWKVTPEKAIIDLPEPNKGQKYSIIPWESQDTEEWLSIEKWMVERSYKDKAPDWKIRLRLEELKELVGKVLQCRGECEVFRGLNSARVQHLSQIREGDEMRVGKDSVAWIYMMDGSLLRLAPETSISFNEINFSKNIVFFEARINQGHAFWSPRLKVETKLDPAPETDSYSLPLPIKEVNLQYFERAIYQRGNDSDHLKEIMVLDDNAIADQFKALNTFRNENNNSVNLSSRLMLVSPNATITSKNAAFDLVYLPGGKSYFKKRTTTEGDELTLELRGYSENELKPITESAWHDVESNGRSYSQMTDVPGHLQVMELLTKRITTIELAREIWLKQFSLPVFSQLENQIMLARDHGYSLWGEEIENRYTFLREYTRRIETTNLRAIENLLAKVEDAGTSVSREVSEDFYGTSLKHYLLGLKSRYDNRKMRVKEMTDLQYYIWILNHGKN
jgi:hypothetical protein